MSRVAPRYFSTEGETAEAPAATDQLDPEVERIIGDILTLNLVQVNQMVTHLKDKFGFVETAAVAVAAAPTGGAVVEEEAAEEEVVREKTAFTVKLLSFDPKGKIKIIKEVRGVAELGLKESKELVESAPCVLAKDLPKENAEKLMETLKAAGAEVELI